MTLTRVVVSAASFALMHAACPTQYSSYKAVVTVSQCTSKDVAMCIVDGQCNEIPPADGATFSFDGQNVRVGQPFDGLIAELPATAVSGDFTYSSVDVGDLSRNSQLKSLSFYRTNRANLNNAKLPTSLTTLNLMSSVGLKYLPSNLDYSKLVTFSAGKELTSVDNLNVPNVQDLSFAANAGLTSITNLKVTSKLTNFNCNACPLTTFTVDATAYAALAAVPATNFSVKSLDVSATCKSPNTVKQLQSSYNVCVLSDGSSTSPTTAGNAPTGTPSNIPCMAPASTTSTAPPSSETSTTPIVITTAKPTTPASAAASIAIVSVVVMAITLLAAT